MPNLKAVLKCIPRPKYLASITTVHIYIPSDVDGIRFITHSKLSVCVWGGGGGWVVYR